MPKAKHPKPTKFVRKARARREVAYLKEVLKRNCIALPSLPSNELAQLRQLQALRDKTCKPIVANHTPATEQKPATARFCSGGLPESGKRK